MKLGMQGISIVLASGDSGVAGPAGDDNSDGCLGTGQIFSPDFPATCPYITTVGVTSPQVLMSTPMQRLPSLDLEVEVDFPISTQFLPTKARPSRPTSPSTLHHIKPTLVTTTRTLVLAVESTTKLDEDILMSPLLVTML